MKIKKADKLRSSILSEFDKAISNLEEGVEVEVGTKYSLSTYTKRQKENWSTSKSIVICENEKQIKDFCKNALADNTYKKKAYFGAVSRQLADTIKEKTGIDTFNMNCCIKADEVRKILINSHGDNDKESNRGQRIITIDDIASIPIIVQSPDEIRLSKKVYEGKPVIEFIKSLNGRTTVISYISKKHMDLSVQTMYSGKNKGSLATTPSGTSPFSHTLEALSGTTSTNNISQNSQKSNTKNDNSEDSALSVNVDTSATQSSLLKENKKLAEMVDYWKRMAQLSKQKDFKRSDVRKISRQLIKDTKSNIELEELTDKLLELYTGLANEDETNASFWDIKAKALAEIMHKAEAYNLKSKITIYMAYFL